MREQTHFARCVPPLKISRTTSATFGEADYCGLSTKTRKQSHLEKLVGQEPCAPDIPDRTSTDVGTTGVPTYSRTRNSNYKKLGNEPKSVQDKERK